jgi:hypothetical protein
MNRCQQRQRVFFKPVSLRRPGRGKAGALFAVAVVIGVIVTLMFLIRSQPASRLIGTWRMDGADELMEQMFDETVDDRVERLGKQVVNELVGKDFVAHRLEIQFQANGVLRTSNVMLNKPYEKQGRWTLDRAEGETMVVHCQLDREDVIETKIEFLDADTIKMIPPNYAVLKKESVFRRAK